MRHRVCDRRDTHDWNLQGWPVWILPLPHLLWKETQKMALECFIGVWVNKSTSPLLKYWVLLIYQVKWRRGKEYQSASTCLSLIIYRISSVAHYLSGFNSINSHTGHCFFLWRDSGTQIEGFYPKSRMQTHFWRKALSALTSSTEQWDLTNHLAVTKHSVASGLSKACSCLLSHHFKLLCSSEAAQEISFFPPFLWHSSIVGLPALLPWACRMSRVPWAALAATGEQGGQIPTTNSHKNAAKQLRYRALYGSPSTKLLPFLRKLKSSPSGTKPTKIGFLH